ncbi:DEAD/DEAH box helicase family protein [Vulcanococcus limneticus]|uniref:DEAD/DEAH box helicase family protein n=1 Tax=Vulcanococcus limneticus TaxID=2170428 RepID=UPI00398C22EF
MHENHLSPFRGMLNDISAIYSLPEDDLAGEVLIPAIGNSTLTSIASGFFSSGALAMIAPGLASAIESESPIRLLLSPELSEEDWEAIRQGIQEPETVACNVLSRLIASGSSVQSALEMHATECLSYLLAMRHIEIRFILMPSGMFHKKQWLILDNSYRIAVHGSGNTTRCGLFVNGEQMSIDREWIDGPRAAQRVDMLFKKFECDWEGRNQRFITISAPAAVEILNDLKPGSARGTRVVPSVIDFWNAWAEDHRSGIAPEIPTRTEDISVRLKIPSSIQWESGRYGHQAVAVEAFAAKMHRGIMAIATGGGKTRCALIAAALYQTIEPLRPLLLVILVPSETLLRQWFAGVKEFSVTPTVIGDISSPVRSGVIAEIEARLYAGGNRTEIVLATLQLFSSDHRIRQLVERVSTVATTMLIADEAHNFGAPSFISNPPDSFKARLGLSATPIRQYDAEGTTALLDFIGPVIYEFSLGEAIKAGCLVPYDYFVHIVSLTEEEMDVYSDLTQQLYMAGFRVDDNGQIDLSNKRVERLLRQRRAVLEQAAGKISALQKSLQTGSISRALIYCSPKELVVASERQIVLVNRVLSELGIISHQLTSKETSNGRSRDILCKFANGEYQALTAMKVLDEGVDVPATEVAYLLASTTVEREWVQRRGRVLRASPGKTSAAVHDFVVVPSRIDDSGRGLLRGEIRRVRAFSELARNRWSPGGPTDTLEELEEMARRPMA